VNWIVKQIWDFLILFQIESKHPKAEEGTPTISPLERMTPLLGEKDAVPQEEDKEEEKK